MFAQSGAVTISGTSSFADNIIIIFRETGALRLEYIRDTIRINKNGTFKQKINVPEAQPARLSIAKRSYQLWLVPGKNIDLQLKDSALTIEGKQRNFSNYYLANAEDEKKLYRSYKQLRPALPANTGEWPMPEYFGWLDSTTKQELLFIDDYFSGYNLPGQKDFIDQQKATILFNNLDGKSSFTTLNYRQLGFLRKKSGLRDTSSAYTFTKNVTLDNRMFLSIFSYRSFIATIIANTARTQITESGEPFSLGLFFSKQMDLIDQLSLDPYCNMANKSIVLNMFASQAHNMHQLFWVSPIDSVLRTIEPADKYNLLAPVRNHLDATVKDSKFRKGAPAPDFKLSDTSGKIYSLKDFKGKKIYIDMWASWCVHCIEMAPAWNNIVKAREGDDQYIFLSVSFEDTRANWLKSLAKHKPEGLLLHAGDGGWTSGFAKQYEINGLPHFLLIDENGLMEAYTAPYPYEVEELKRFGL